MTLPIWVRRCNHKQDEAMVSYRVLDGPDGSYRYLLSARDGRMLERALIGRGIAAPEPEDHVALSPGTTPTIVLALSNNTS